MPLAVRPTDGPLNFVAAMPQSRKPPDVGPKTYVALGRREERGEVRGWGVEWGVDVGRWGGGAGEEGGAEGRCEGVGLGGSRVG